jgi:hypothetical protein
VRLRLRAGGRSVLAARRSGARDSAGRLTLLLTPTPGARARLRRTERAALALDVTARDDAGNRRKIVRALALRG